MRVLMVCLGNICRSPTAEGVFRAAAARRGLAHVVVDSAGTAAYHVGEPPDPRTVTAARTRGYDLSSLRARQVTADDARAFDLVLAMDRANLAHLERTFASVDERAETALFLSYARGLDVAEVPDPYYGGAEGFARVLDLCERASEAVLDAIVEGRVAPRSRLSGSR